MSDVYPGPVYPGVVYILQQNTVVCILTAKLLVYINTLRRILVSVQDLLYFFV